ncbi:hypothetical protein D1007_26525 [Hordeum vulgare]|nr:hypothetical protein D1007_26525 [Hordeum vulgare]
MLQVLGVSMLGSRVPVGGAALLCRHGRLDRAVRRHGQARGLPRPTFPKGSVLAVRGGIHKRSTKQFICEEACRVKVLWCFVSFSDGVFDGGGSWRQVLVFLWRGLQGLFCNFSFYGVFSAKCQDS